MIWVKLLFILQFKMAIAPSWNILFKKSDVRMKNRAGESALETAIRMGDVQIQNVIFAACEAGNCTGIDSCGEGRRCSCYTCRHYPTLRCAENVFVGTPVSCSHWPLLQVNLDLSDRFVPGCPRQMRSLSPCRRMRLASKMIFSIAGATRSARLQRREETIRARGTSPCRAPFRACLTFSSPPAVSTLFTNEAGLRCSSGPSEFSEPEAPQCPRTVKAVRRHPNPVRWAQFRHRAQAAAALAGRAVVMHTISPESSPGDASNAAASLPPLPGRPFAPPSPSLSLPAWHWPDYTLTPGQAVADSERLRPIPAKKASYMVTGVRLRHWPGHWPTRGRGGSGKAAPGPSRFQSQHAGVYHDGRMVTVTVVADLRE